MKFALGVLPLILQIRVLLIADSSVEKILPNDTLSVSERLYLIAEAERYSA